MAVRCIGIRLSLGGHYHHQITHIKAVPPADGMLYTRATMVKFVEEGGQAYVQDSRGNVAYLRVRSTLDGTKYVQTYADGIPSDNLLALPRV